MLFLLTVLEINIFRSSPQKAIQTFTARVKFCLSWRYFNFKLLIYVWFDYLLYRTFSACNTGPFALTYFLQRDKSCVLVDLDGITSYVLDRLKKNPYFIG
jgi:hypothetical protein